MLYGASQLEFLINSPDTFAQAVQTRLALLTGEWFLDKTEGTPWNTQILGVRTQSTYDRAIRDRIAGTQGFKSIVKYSSNFDGNTRKLTVNAVLDSIFGVVTIQQVL
jgi:hypothetical protein